MATLLAAIVAPLRGEALRPSTGMEQIAIPRVERMRNLPARFEVPDWGGLARRYAALVFDLRAAGAYMPLVWIDRSRVNFPEDTFGLYVTVGDPRGGPLEAGGAYHDAVNDIAAVLGSTVAGLDMSDYKGRNWVRMSRAHFNRANGRDVFMEFAREFDPARTGGGYGRDFWYDTLPSLLAMELGAAYPRERSLAAPLRRTADQFARATDILLATPRKFDWSTFDWKTMKPVENFIPGQPDAAGGFANLLLLAYRRFRDTRYRNAALRCLTYLNTIEQNPLYDAMLPDGVYAMARANAEFGKSYDVARLLAWCFAGGTKTVEGVHAGVWGDYDVSGLVEMRGVRRLYAAETFKMAKSLIPVVRYDARFARAIGKWMSNAASNMRYFYPDYLPKDHQMAPEYRGLTRGVIGYEAITAQSMYGDRPVPFAERDAWSGTYTPSGEPTVWPKASQYSLYGSSYVGFFAVARRTSDSTILELDCLKTDFGHSPAYPTYLYYNPNDTRREIVLDLGPKRTDLYDAASHRFVLRGGVRKVRLSLEADSAAVIVRAPAGAILRRRGKTLYAGGVAIDFRLPEAGLARPGGPPTLPRFRRRIRRRDIPDRVTEGDAARSLHSFSRPRLNL